MVDARTVPRSNARPRRSTRAEHRHSLSAHFRESLEDLVRTGWRYLLHLPLLGIVVLRSAILLRALHDAFAFVLNGFRVPVVRPFDPDVYYYEAPTEPRMRSPCPAINTLANHGYLPRNGRRIDRATMIHALQQGFGLTYVHAWFITTNGYLLTGQWRLMSLFDLRRHDGIEHNASLAHADAAPGDEYAPARVDRALFDALAARSADGGRTLGVREVALARVCREEESELDALHAEIARGEIGLILDVFGGRSRRVDVDMLRQQWAQERFPEGWQPTRRQSLVRTMLTSQLIKQHMTAIRAHGPDAEAEETWAISFCKAYLHFFDKWEIARLKAQKLMKCS